MRTFPSMGRLLKLSIIDLKQSGGFGDGVSIGICSFMFWKAIVVGGGMSTSSLSGGEFGFEGKIWVRGGWSGTG